MELTSPDLQTWTYAVMSFVSRRWGVDGKREWRWDPDSDWNLWMERDKGVLILIGHSLEYAARGLDVAELLHCPEAGTGKTQSSYAQHMKHLIGWFHVSTRPQMSARKPNIVTRTKGWIMTVKYLHQDGVWMVSNFFFFFFFFFFFLFFFFFFFH